jgi:hypothetical protein
MTTIFHRNREKTAGIPEESRLWLKRAAMVILIGGFIVAAVAFFIQKKGPALGLFLGTILSILNFYSLHALSGKILKAGSRGGKIFWFWTIFRWAIAALICWGLVLISPSCLLGALGGYLWALGVLGWRGWRAASSDKTSPRPLEKD